MSKEPRAAPLVALVVRWAMLGRRQGQYIPAEVLNLLVCLAERHNAQEGCSRPGNFTVGWDVGAASKDYIRKWLRVAASLGAVTYREGKGRGHASEIRFTSDVWQAPQLDYLSRLDQVRLSEATANGRPAAMPIRPRRTADTKKGRQSNALFNARKGRGAKLKRTTPDEKRATDNMEKGDTASPPTVVTAVEPLEPLVRPSAASIRPSAASISPAGGLTTTNGNGALTAAERERLSSEAPTSVYLPPARRTEPPPRVDQIRQRLAVRGLQHTPMNEAQEAERRRFLAEQKEALLRELGGSQ